MMASVPARFQEAVGASDGTSMGADLTWSVTAYVCHVADNLRISAEKKVGVARRGRSTTGRRANTDITAFDRLHCRPLSRRSATRRLRLVAGRSPQAAAA